MLNPTLIDGKRFKTPNGEEGRVIGNVFGGWFLVQFDGADGSQVVQIDSMADWIFDPPQEK